MPIRVCVCVCFVCVCVCVCVFVCVCVVSECVVSERVEKKGYSTAENTHTHANTNTHTFSELPKRETIERQEGRTGKEGFQTR